MVSHRKKTLQIHSRLTLFRYQNQTTLEELKTLMLYSLATFSLKKGKSCDDESISAEHFFYAPLPLFIRLQHLFNMMLSHSFVPAQFQFGTIIPLVKDHQGNLGDPHNYRGITISPIVSKIFEHVLKIIFSVYLTTSKYQFGFKRKSSTSHVLFKRIN